MAFGSNNNKKGSLVVVNKMPANTTAKAMRLYVITLLVVSSEAGNIQTITPQNFRRNRNCDWHWG